MDDRLDRLFCAPAIRIEALERLVAVQFQQMSQHLGKIEASMLRLERRLWVTVFGVATAVLGEAVLSVVQAGI